MGAVAEAMTERFEDEIALDFGFVDHCIPLTLYLKLAADTIGVNEWVLRAPSFIAGVTDARYFRERGIPAYGFSPFALSPGDAQVVLPGDNVNMRVKLICPIAMEEGVRFAIREGGRTVGAGRVIKIIE